MANFYEDFSRELLRRNQLVEEGNVVDETQVERLAQQLEKRVAIFVLRQLSKEQLDAYAKVVFEDGSPEKIHDFLKTHISDFEQKREQLFKDFTREFVEQTRTLRSALDAKE